MNLSWVSLDRSRRDRLAIAVLIVISIIYIISRSIGLDQSLWEDEMYTVHYYVGSGLARVFDPDAYIANNHPLFSILASGLVGIFGNSEVVLRIGSVVPATAATALMTYWLWRHYGRVASVTFAFLMTLSPLHFEQFRQARGWGLALLGATIVLVTSLEIQRTESIKLRHAVWFIVGSLVGIWSIYALMLPFAVHGAILLISRRERWKLIAVGSLVAAGFALFYWPLRSIIRDPAAARGQGSGSPARQGFVTLENVVFEPLHRLVAPLFDLALPTSIAVFVAAALVVGGAALLVRTRQWSTFLHLLLPVAVVFVVLAVRRAGIWDRYVSFLLPYILGLSALGVSMVWSLFSASRRTKGVLALFGAVAALGIVLGFGRFAIPIVSMPQENFKGAARMIEGALPVKGVYTYSLADSFNHYLDRVTVQEISRAEFHDRSCTQEGPLVFVDYPRRMAGADTSCLEERGARIVIQHRRRSPQITVWLVP